MLTDGHCKNARCSHTLKRERLSDSGGLYLEVSPTGSKRWFWKYRINGKEGRMALGSYPSVGLTAARKARDAAKLQKAEGVDPVKARKVERLKASNPAGIPSKWSRWSGMKGRRASGVRGTQSAHFASLSVICFRGLASAVWPISSP